MLDLIHKILYTGIGFAVLTEEKAREIAADLEQKGEVSSEQGKKLAQELVEKARHQSQELRKTISDEVNKLAGKFKWVSRQELDDLKQRLDELEKRSCASSSDDSL